MVAYALRRLLALIPVLLFVSFVTFALVRLAPGDPVLIVLGGKKVDPATAAALREQFGLVGDPFTQYVAWLGRALSGDLGESYRLRQDVVSLIADRLPLTIQLVGLSMVLAIAVFAFTAWLGQGDALGYTLVCVGSGAALGAKLVAPAALLAGAIGRTEGARQDEGLWFGWWNLVSKLALALAAGLALPLVQALGYRQGDASSVAGLVIVYALVPCVLEALALVALMARRRTHEPPKASSPAAGAAS